MPVNENKSVWSNGLPSLLYWCKMRILYCRHIMKMESFHMQVLHVILGITLHDQTTDLEILNHEDFTSIWSMLIKAHIWWTGHVLCMKQHCFTRHLYRKLLCVSQPKKWYKDSINANLHWCKTRPKKLREGAVHQSYSHNIVHKISVNLKNNTTVQLWQWSHPLASRVPTTSDYVYWIEKKNRNFLRYEREL